MKNLSRILWKDTISFAIRKDQSYHVLNGDSVDDLQKTDLVLDAGEVKILPPVLPSKIVAVGLNYIDHANELKMDVPEQPILFMKPATAIIGPGDYIEYPETSKQVDYEAELVIVIKKKAFKVKAGQVHDYILGYTCGNDVTARDLQKIDGQWTRAKSFNTFCPIGPEIITGLDPDNLDISLTLNGQKRQSSNTKNMIFNSEFLVHFISQIMTLNPGDIIMTGTPPGVGEMFHGDKVEVKVEKIGSLINRVKPML